MRAIFWGKSVNQPLFSIKSNQLDLKILFGIVSPQRNVHVICFLRSFVSLIAFATFPPTYRRRDQSDANFVRNPGKNSQLIRTPLYLRNPRIRSMYREIVNPRTDSPPLLPNERVFALICWKTQDESF